MEKRSHRRIRDLDVLMAFQGLVANEIGCARISMMASEQETLPQWAEYRCARPIISRSSHPACTARPVHTKVHGEEKDDAVATTFLHNHAGGIGSMDLFLVPTISFRLLYGLLILRHARRELLWLGVTAHPSAEWIVGQLTEAYGWQQAPRYIIRDRDCVYGDVFVRRIRAMGIRDRPIAPRSPWQNGCAERLIGSIRRDCLDHFVVFGEQHLRHLLKSYQAYYNEARTHLSLQKDAPIPRAVQTVGQTLAVPVFGGLHHRYIPV